jgi:hypothetical protein
MALRVSVPKPAAVEEPMDEMPMDEMPMHEEMEALPEEEMVEEMPEEGLAPFATKVSPMVSGYRGPEMGPFMCSNCQYFGLEGENSCQVVEGFIEAEGMCNLFTGLASEEVPMDAPIEEEVPMEDELAPEEVFEDVPVEPMDDELPME